jgi:hypothetical protein
MNAEELIIAHFDRSLSPEQETALRQLLEQSPEARSLYERHETIEGMIDRESAALVPSDRLDEAVIASALGIWRQVAVGGGLWLTGKFAAGISALAIGGIAIAIFSTSRIDTTPAHVQKDIPPAVLKLPALPPPVTLPATQETTPAPTAEAPVTEPARVNRMGTVAASNNSGTKEKPSRQTPQHIDFGDKPDVNMPNNKPALIKPQPPK